MACIWWRDDDAGRDDPRLERLLELATARRRPVALAVVPDWLEPATVERIRACPLATVLQHGVAHADHGTAATKTIELGGGADRERLFAALAAGRRRLEAAFGAQFLAVLVPPWNRIDDDVTAAVPALGFAGLSCDGGPARTAPPRRVDVHVDAVDWHGTGRPRPPAEVEAALRGSLATVDGPVGLMTHHQVVEGDEWDGLDRVLGFGHGDGGVSWLTAKEAFGVP